MAQSTHNPDYQLLLTVLKAARKRAGVSQIDLAERLGNTQTFVSKCERGERRIDAVELVEFAEALGVPLLVLLGEHLERGTKAKFKRASEGLGKAPAFTANKPLPATKQNGTKGSVLFRSYRQRT